jgi:parvulin-like peptidyl-prolyl isomerase
VSDQRIPGSRRPLVLLVLAVAVGVASAFASRWVVPSPARTLPPDAIARVNDAFIRREDYERALDSLASDRRTAVDAEQRRHLLNRLIEEELLMQYGLAAGLIRQNPRLRADLAAAVAAIVTAEYDAQPTHADLAAFYEAHRDRFVEPGRVRIRQIFFRVADPADAASAQARAEATVARIRSGESFATVREQSGDREILPPPDTPLSAAELREYLGPTVTRAVLSLPVDGVSDPIRSGTGFHIVQILERLPDAPPPLAQIEDQVIAEYRRSHSEAALRAYLDDLRRQANVEIQTED